MAKLTGKDKELADRMNTLLKEFGYTTTRYFVSKGMGESRFTINVTNPAEDGSVQNPYEAAYKSYHQMEGYQLSWLGMTVNYGGHMVTLKGFLAKTRGPVKVVYQKGAKLFVCDPLTFKLSIEHTLKKRA